MFSQQELMDMIYTEGLHGDWTRPQLPELRTHTSQPTVEYSLRLVKHEDGSVEWRED